MASEANVRPMTEADVPETAFLLVKCLPEWLAYLCNGDAVAALALTGEQLRAGYPHGEGAFVAESEGRIVGFVLADIGQGVGGGEYVRRMLRVVATHLPPRVWPRFLLGAASMQGAERDAAYIAAIGVDEAARGAGLGTRLLRRVEEWARSRGVSRLILRVSLSKPRVQALYERLGFRPVRVQEMPLAELLVGEPGVVHMRKEPNAVGHA